MEVTNFGKVAFEAWFKGPGQGDPPDWDDLPEEEKRRWIVSAQASITAFCDAPIWAEPEETEG